MISSRRAIIMVFAMVAAGCTIEKKASVPADTAQQSILPPPPLAVPPSKQVVPPSSPNPGTSQQSAAQKASTESMKAMPKLPPKLKKEPPVTGGLERDSVIQPSMAVGADGKLHPIKK